MGNLFEPISWAYSSNKATGNRLGHLLELLLLKMFLFTATFQITIEQLDYHMLHMVLLLEFYFPDSLALGFLSSLSYLLYWREITLIFCLCLSRSFTHLWLSLSERRYFNAAFEDLIHCCPGPLLPAGVRQDQWLFERRDM